MMPPADPIAARRHWPTGTIPATVPGCVHTDLLAAGLIPDPYLRPKRAGDALDRPLRLDLPHHASSSPTMAGLTTGSTLVFDGLDTIATVSPQRSSPSATADEHAPSDTASTSKRGPSRGATRLDDPLCRTAARYAEQMEQEFGPRPHVGAGSNEHLPHQMMRKMACNFGWDWGPQLLTCGRVAAGADRGVVRPPGSATCVRSSPAPTRNRAS